MPDDPDDVVRRAFLLDADPPHVRPPRPLPPLELHVDLEPLPAMHVVPPRFEPPQIDREQFERAASIVADVHAALVTFAQALLGAVRSIVETFQRAFPAPLLVEFAQGAKYVRRMEAHRHRTAGRPRSRMRPGRSRRRR